MKRRILNESLRVVWNYMKSNEHPASFHSAFHRHWDIPMTWAVSGCPPEPSSYRPVSRASILRPLDRHLPVKGVKVLHCVHCLSVKCAFGDDYGPARTTDTRIGQSNCRSARSFNVIGRRKWQSTVPLCHWCSVSMRGRAMWAIAVQFAGRTHGWADHSGDSNAPSLATNCQKNKNKKSGQQNGESTGKRNFWCGSHCGRLTAWC